jgi:ribonucleoside-diphosphate reductase alpha chain
MEERRSFSLENEAVSGSRNSVIQFVTTRNGEKIAYDEARTRQFVYEACRGYEDVVSSELVYKETERQLYNGIKETDLMQAAIMAARPFVESEPAYSFVAARLLLQITFDEVLGSYVTVAQRESAYRNYFPRYLEMGIEAERLNPQLKNDFDISKIAAAIKPERDEIFTFLGLQTLYDRYFIHIDKRRIELPQIFWMRVAMGLALVEKTLNERTQKAIEFYNLLSCFDYVSSTPTLFNSGTVHSQLSSCF